MRNTGGKPLTGAKVDLCAHARSRSSLTDAQGGFTFRNVPAGSYQLSVEIKGDVIRYPQPVEVPPNAVSAVLSLSNQGELSLEFAANPTAKAGGEDLSSHAVSELPLNKRDFSQLLLLAAGTMTDANGATNFTQQFAINGQRGVEAVFAMDGADISDPEMGGATFTNFNVDAVQEIQSRSGWMPAEIGRGASGFTNIVTRSGSSGFHGSVFEFLRNSALDAPQLLRLLLYR